MKVIFKKDYNNIGRIGEVKEVSDGYAMNFLFPQKIAVPATLVNMQSIAQRKDVGAKREEKKEATLKKLVKKIELKKVEIRKQANDDGKLFASVTALDIVKRLLEKKYEIPVNLLKIEKPIKNLGLHTVAIYHKDKKFGEITVLVEREQ